MDLEKLKIDYMRKGALDRVKFLESMDKNILPSQLKRIQQNDKTVLKEMVLPKWVKWELLQEWANNTKVSERNGEMCILCNEKSSTGIDFNEKFICEHCFIRLKHADHEAVMVKEKL